jgi:MinD superfamily P-loop ATPase
MEYKRCSECKRHIEIRKFYKDRTQPDGFSSWCKSCMNCGVVRERAVYGDGERQWGDPTEEQIARECLRFQASWSNKVRQSRKGIRQM